MSDVSTRTDLHRHLGGHGGVDDGGELVGGEYPERVADKVPHRDELSVADPLQSRQGQLTLLLQADVVPEGFTRSSNILWLTLVYF